MEAGGKVAGVKSLSRWQRKIQFSGALEGRGLDQ